MIRNFLFILFFAIVHPFSQVDGHDVIQNKLVIKFQDSFSPKLGTQESITVEQLQSLSDRFKNLNIIEFRPLFFKNQNFSEIEYKYSLHQYYVLDIDNEIDYNRLKSDLESIDQIDIIEPVFIKKTNFVPNDPYYSDQWAHDNYGQASSGSGGGSVGTDDADTDTDLAWDITTGDPSIIIAILDTGVNEHS